MRWHGHIKGQEDPNGHAQLIQMSEWGSRPIAWLWESLQTVAEKRNEGRGVTTSSLISRLSGLLAQL